MVEKKKRPKKVTPPRIFGVVVMTKRVTKEEDAAALKALGARMFKEDEAGYHFELDELAAKSYRGE